MSLRLPRFPETHERHLVESESIAPEAMGDIAPDHGVPQKSPVGRRKGEAAGAAAVARTSGTGRDGTRTRRGTTEGSLAGSVATCGAARTVTVVGSCRVGGPSASDPLAATTTGAAAASAGIAAGGGAAGAMRRACAGASTGAAAAARASRSAF